MFGLPKNGEVDYTKVLELDLSTVRGSVAGPKRPQDRIELDVLKTTFANMLQAEPPNGYGKSAEEIARKIKTVVGISRESAEVAGGGDQASPCPTRRARATRAS
jgi:aconitate hydratase